MKQRRRDVCMTLNELERTRVPSQLRVGSSDVACKTVDREDHFSEKSES